MLKSHSLLVTNRLLKSKTRVLQRALEPIKFNWKKREIKRENNIQFNYLIIKNYTVI